MPAARQKSRSKHSRTRQEGGDVFKRIRRQYVGVASRFIKFGPAYSARAKHQNFVVAILYVSADVPVGVRMVLSVESILHQAQ